ncbi:MAG: L-fucokinase-domain-containing protein [Benniella sp.]|nr:MAG: L-fucokinase-domain-containing protein [Benniella sp.]
MESFIERTRGGALSNLLRDTHAQNLAAYRRILTSSPVTATATQLDPFWDVVVVTAGDAQQRLVYEQRINQELDGGRIPSQAKYHVVDDPPGSKIGSGGSTLLVMKVLKDLYPPEFLNKARVLLIHAGGYSTRLPHVSARGKVFTILPQANSRQGIHVMELKLVLYLHLLRSMPPGVFLTSADGIELFASKDPFSSELKPFTITALAHPSSTQIGSTHGVYLLKDPNERVIKDKTLPAHEQSALLLECERFLHKPSLDVMKATQNVIYHGSSSDAQDIVYTDSCYYFDPQTAGVMANTYAMLSSDCDLEAWADILSFQDQYSSDCQDTLSTTMDSHQKSQRIVRQAFLDAGMSLKVMVLNASKFYHLGTMEEFIAGTCTDEEFMSELHIRNSNPGIARVYTEQQDSSQDGQQQEQKSESHIQAPGYIENSLIPFSARIQSHSIIVDSDLPVDAMIPLGSCLFTLQLREHEFVTFTFSVKDDMKKVATTLQDLNIFELVPVSEVLSPSGPDISPLSLLTTSSKGMLSLWTAPVFEIARSRTASIQLALNRLHRIQHYLYQAESGAKNTVKNRTDPVQPEVVDWTSLKDAARRARGYCIHEEVE